MEIIRIPRVMQDISMGHRLHSKTIGFVPTMGALHEGHLSLIKICKQENDITVVSIYVNPLQFGRSEDLSVYPKDMEGDMQKLRGNSVDMLFIPDDSVMYPQAFSTYVEVEGLSEKLCGKFRPSHFRGVTTVATKLLNIVRPDNIYLGQKDFQQALLIKKLIRDLAMGIDVAVCPTIREADGLAMSSRNLYLSQEEKQAATVIYKSISKAAESIKSGISDVRLLKKIMLDLLGSEKLISEVQYCSIYNQETLEELEVIGEEALIALAVKIGRTRLIDNMIVSVSDKQR